MITVDPPPEAVFGSEPEILFYSQRRSATGYIYTYSLLEPHPAAARMQDEMIAEVEANRPDFLVVVEVEESWNPQPESPEKIVKWMRTYALQFEVVGVAEVFYDGSRFLTQRDLANSKLAAKSRVVILKRSQS